MEVTPAVVRAEHERFHDRAKTTVRRINETRETLAAAFDTEVTPVTVEAYRREVDAVFADGDVAVNVAALAGLLREVDVMNDYPGFVVDEQLGRLLAGTIAGTQPRETLAEATFHVADSQIQNGDGAGSDDLAAALAAGFQTRLPGWEWTATDSPFSVGENETRDDGEHNRDGPYD